MIFGGRHWRLGGRSEMHLSSCRTIFREMLINANNAWDDTSNPLINPSLSRRQRHHWHCTVRKESSCLSATWPNNTTCFLPLVWVVKGVEPNWFRENHPVCWLQIAKERWLIHRWPSLASLHASIYWQRLYIHWKTNFWNMTSWQTNKKQLQLLRLLLELRGYHTLSLAALRSTGFKYVLPAAMGIFVSLDIAMILP